MADLTYFADNKNGLKSALSTAGILSEKKIVAKEFTYQSVSGKILKADDSVLYITSTGDISATAGQDDVAVLTLKDADGSDSTAATYNLTAVQLLGGNGEWSVEINDSNITEYTGLATAKDNLTVTTANDNFVVKTIGDGSAGILDTIDIKQGTANVVIDKGASGLTVAEGGLDIVHGDSEMLFKKDAVLGGTASGLVIGGEQDKLTFANSANDAIKFVGEVVKGDVSLAKGSADSEIDATIKGGTLTNQLDALNSASVLVEEGSYVDGALTAGKESKLAKLTKSAPNTFVSAAGSSVVIKAGEIETDGLTLNMSNANTGAADEIEINTLKGDVTHTISGDGAKINITDAAAEGTYTAGDDEDNTIGIKFGAVKLESESETGELKLTAVDDDTNGKTWSFDGQAGKVVATTGSKTEDNKDNITLGGQMAGFTVTSGEAADLFILEKGLSGTTTGAVSIEGGAGDDIFDLSDRAGVTGSGNIVVNYSQGETSTKGGENGFDKIFVGGDSVNIGEMSYSDGKLVVRGVEFALDDSKYVQFGSGDMSDADFEWVTYQADAANKTLKLVADDSQDVDGDGTEHYDTQDASKTTEVIDKDSDDVVKDDTFDGAQAVDDDTIKDTNSTFADNKDENARKFVELDKQNWAATGKDLNMGSVGTSYVVVAKNSAANGSIKMGGTKTTENNIVLKGKGTADLSKVTFKDYKSTKDVLIAPIALDNYRGASADEANEFINFTDGTYGGDVVASAGTLGASSVKGGLYAAKFRQSKLNDDTGDIAQVDNEVMVVAGAASAASGDFSSASTQIFAMTVNNEDISDSVIGSKYEDVFVAGKNDVIDGGKGNDTIFTGGEAVTVALATGKETDNDIINGWKSNKGTIQLAKGKDFSNISVETYTKDTAGAGAGSMTFADGSGANAQATLNFNSSDTAKLGDNVLVKVNDGNGNSKTALVFDGTNGANVSADYVATANLYVGSAKGENLLDFSGTGKGNIFLGHSDGKDAEFGDTAQYVNVKNVKSDSVGGAWVFGGGSNQVTLAAGGDSDSLWGGGKKSDTLISNDTYRTVFGTTNGAGVDVVQGFKFGADAYGETTNTDIVYFVDGVDLSKMKVSDGKFIVGSSDKSAIAFDLDSVGGANTDEGALITYSLGLGGPKYVAKADVTKDTTANAEITFTEDATLYLGRGDKTTLVFNANNGNPTRFGFDSKYSGYKVGTLDGREAVAGSLINGSTDRAQKVYASEAGASSIAGGFGEGFVDGNSDTLIGGGDSEFGTTFFVGKDMGSDLIQNLSDGDTVVFLNTKVSDITNNINSDTYGKNVSVVFNSGSRITATSTNNIADLEGVTVQFTDGTFTYDGVSKSWVRANA